MSNIFAYTSKNRAIPKFLALFAMASVILPSTLLVFPITTSAQELQTEMIGDEIRVAETVENVIGPVSDIEPTSGGPTTNSTGGSSSRGQSHGQDNRPTTGSITICKVIFDSNNRVATSSANLPAGTFSVNLTKDGNLLRTASFNTATFIPNARLIGDAGNDAQCTTVSNLTLGQLYNWSEESITGAATSTWQTPRYNDQFTVNVSGLTDFFLFDANNGNADGIIGLTPERPNRTLMILNRYNAVTVPPTGSITVCKMIADTGNRVATSSTNLPAGVFSVNLFDSSFNLLRTARFDTTTFIPNARIIVETGSDAQCLTVGNLALGQLYLWTEESITGAAISTWHAPKYNDQFTENVNGLSNFYLFDIGNGNADGIIGLTSERPNRTVAVLNRYTADAPPPPPPPPPPPNSAPIITIIGANSMSVTVEQSFIDPGATAFDVEDGNITSRIVATGTVDTNTVGSYLRTYSVTDSGGLTDIETRTVNVVSAGNGGGGGGSGGGGGGGRYRNSSRDTVPDIAINELSQACPFLVDDLHRNRVNKPIEVLKLQYFLKYYENFTELTLNSVFDQATFNAVSKFQERYADDILKPWGHDSPTGFVYILTKKKINEIFCQTAFPITLSQEQEIKSFRELLTSSKRTAIQPSVIKPNIETELGRNSTTTEASKTISEPIKDISDIVGLAPPISTPNGHVEPNNLNAIASAIFSMPNSRGAFFRSLYFLLIAIIAVYLATEIVVGSMGTNKLSKHQVWARKISGYIIGLFIAIIAAILYKVFSIIIPLLILAIVSGTFLAWTITKKTGNKIIHLPPTSKK